MKKPANRLKPTMGSLATVPPPYTGPRWEYKSMVLDTMDEKVIVSAFNSAGRDGFELTAILPGQGGAAAVAYFKRQRPTL